jgi:hypothetical protein
MFKLLAALSAFTAAVSGVAVRANPTIFKLHPTSDVLFHIDYLRWGEYNNKLNGPVGWFNGGDGTGNDKIVELIIDGAGVPLNANDTAYQLFVSPPAHHLLCTIISSLRLITLGQCLCFVCRCMM